MNPDAPEGVVTHTPKIETPIVASQGRDTVSAEEFRLSLTDILPQAWLEDVGSISQVNYEDSSTIKKYGLSSGAGVVWKTIAIATRQGAGSRTNITFFNHSKSLTTSSNLKSIMHEVGHANDWARDRQMDPAERAELLLAITSRLNDPDRYRSNYVESIKNEKDKQAEKYLKAVEYWAEISAVYFTNPGALHVKDFEIVDAHIGRTDPGFSSAKALQAVQNLTLRHPDGPTSK